MGEYVDTPFRVMDEFDIFMDAANREMSMRLLQEFARDHTHMQFIFVTPNDCSMLPTSDFCRVQKMKPPVKDYGGLAQATINPDTGGLERD